MSSVFMMKLSRPSALISGTTDSPDLKKLEKMMLQCSELDREINCFVGSVEEMTAQVCCIHVE